MQEINDRGSFFAPPPYRLIKFKAPLQVFVNGRKVILVDSLINLIKFDFFLTDQC